MSAKPGGTDLAFVLWTWLVLCVCSFACFLLLYPLLLALCVGLTPRAGENRRVALPSQA